MLLARVRLKFPKKCSRQAKIGGSRVTVTTIMPSVPFTLEDLEANLELRFIDRGAVYFRQGKVGELYVDRNGRHIEALVRGSRSRPYAVDIRINGTREDREIEGYCTCPVGYNCKHVAAILLAALEKSRVADAPAPVPEPPGTPTEPVAVQGWLERIQNVIIPQPADDESYPPTVRRRLLYVLVMRNPSRLEVDLLSAYLLKNGSFGNASRYNPASIAQGRPAAHILPSDQAILRRMLEM